MLLSLCLSFLQIGAFAFGGGYAVLAFIQKELIVTQQLITPEVFVNLVAIAQMTPGSMAVNASATGFFRAMLFGIIFSVGWTPCVGAFLGSALMLASQRGHVLEGVAMLLAYSQGLGIPFLISAVLIDYLKNAFRWIKTHYRVINAVCGALLVVLGILMATGTMGRLLAVLS